MRGFNWIGSARGSITRVNIRGDRGHSCLVSLGMVNGSDSRPEVHTLALGREKNLKLIR